MGRPNLFDHATSELSQDAALCWLFAWADSGARTEDLQLHEVGRALMNLCLEKHGRPPLEGPCTIELVRQWERIDILVIINHEIVLLIEDKTGTREHSDQLRRYRDAIAASNAYGRMEVLPIYLHTGEQDSYAAIRQAGYEVIRRTELLNVLDRAGGECQSDILRDFRAHLHRIEAEVNAFRTISPTGKWERLAWRGFFAELRTRLGDGSWGYVANPSGGFHGYWWNFQKVEAAEAYLQLEDDRLCFKIAVENAALRSSLKYDWSQRVLRAGASVGVAVERPSRLRNGTWMTVAHLADGYRVADAAGRLDWDATLERIQDAKRVLDAAVVAGP